jgi:Reverse transcriptase (RNA-dependent DNA polymerase)/Integrase core domain/gag-polypeptide of LTR copia-type/GAG-pre-integrase domain
MAEDHYRSNSPLTNILLDGKNYLPWARAVTVALGGRSKLGHINGKTPKPTNWSEAWEASDQLVMNWLFNSMRPEIYEIFSYSETAKGLWEKLEEMYGRSNHAARVFELQQNLAKCKKGSTQSVTEHLGNMTKQWEELRLYRPVSSQIDDYKQREEQDRIFLYLASLGPEFEEARRSILLRPELPSFGRVCSIIQSEEDRIRVMSSENKVASDLTENSALNTVSNNRDRGDSGKGKEKTKFYCNHCRREGHSKERCWVLHPHLRPARSKPREANLCEANSSTTADQSTTGSNASMEAKFNELARQVQMLIQAQKSASGPEVVNAVRTNGNILNSNNQFKLVIDSGASDNMVFNDTGLIKFDKNCAHSHVLVANGHKIPTTGKGKISIFSKETDAIVVPELKSNLLSVSKCTNNWNCNIIFTPQKVIFQDRISGKMIGEGKLSEGLYVVNSIPSAMAAINFNSVSLNLWHSRLGHPSDYVIKHLGIDSNSVGCDSCHYAKQHRLPFSDRLNKADKLFDLVHSDTWGNAPIDSKEGYKYFVTFIDDKSRATWLYLLKSKREVPITFKNFCIMIENQFGTTIKVLRSDNGTEYTNNELQTFLQSKGISHQTSCVGTPQQNGVAERKNRHLLEITRALLFSANMPKEYWAVAVRTACYLINRLPSRILEFKSPLEIIYNRKINISHLKVFGSVCYVHSQEGNKLDLRAHKCVFVGYSSTKKGYICFKPDTQKTFVSRDVTFNEKEMFFESNNRKQGEHDIYNQFSLPYPEVFRPEMRESSVQGTEPDESSFSNEETGSNVAAASSEGTGPLDSPSQGEFSANHPYVPDNANPVRRSSRMTQRPTRLNDFVTYSVKFPIEEQIKYDKISKNFCTFLTRIEECNEPTSFEEAKKSEIWTKAMHEELNAMNKNYTWDIVPLPLGKKPVGCRWIYKIKFNSDGSIERYKARLVAKGYTQTYGLDYKETFAPVAKMNTVRVLMSVAVINNWPLFQMDVKNAFLQGNLEEEVYMEIPPGLHVPQGNQMVCRLKKAIYGLKQSPRAWYGRLSNALGKIGYKRSDADHSLFTTVTKRGIVVILIYVDDLVITGSDQIGIQALKEHLRLEFDIKDLGVLRYFLGIEIARSQKGLFLCQRKYIMDLLKETGKLSAKPATTPMDCNNKDVSDVKVLDDISQFQRLVGKLIYLTITRPDISYAVGFVSQFMQRPTKGHMELVDQILRYLKATPGRGILMKNQGHTNLTVYTDADWAGNPTDRRSTSGLCAFVGGNLVTWQSKKQPVVAKSSAEAEYRAMSNATSEIVWLRLLLHELGCPSLDHPTKLFCDNQAAMHIASNPVFHERTKHIEVSCHYVRENLLNRTIETPYIRSEDQLADVFTKALTKRKFEEIVDKLTSDDIFRST